MGLQARIRSKIGAFWDGASLRWRFYPNRKERLMDLQRAVADRDHLIRELADELERLVEVAPSGTDVKPALRLYNRAQDLVGWEDDAG
jgi:predicted AlkP superfamily phosphohydrolase/phosphomutase